MSATLTDRTGSMGSLPPDAPPPISLPAQQGHLLRRYPNSRVVRRRERLLWSGTLTPAEYTATYELLIDHQIGKPPLVYVVRPRLRLVDGQGLPHVYPLNTCACSSATASGTSPSRSPIRSCHGPASGCCSTSCGWPPAGNGSEKESTLHQDQ